MSIKTISKDEYKKVRVYFCPACRQAVITIKEVNIFCGDCGRKMVKAEAAR